MALILEESLKLAIALFVEDKISGSSLKVECLVKAVLGSSERGLVKSVSFWAMLPVVIDGGVELPVVFPEKKNYYLFHSKWLRSVKARKNHID